MKKIVIFIFFITIVLSSKAQDAPFKALYMFNISKLIDWPEEYKQGDFVIAILGSSDVSKEFTGKRVIQQSIVPKEFESLSEIGKCNILYIPAEETAQLTAALSKYKGKPTLVISDGGGLAQKGSCITFVKKGTQLQIEISKTNIERQGLKVSSDLLTIGISVD